MKGPGFRYDLDIRRVWECPKCGKRLRYLGHVTSKRCNCDEEGHWMTIVAERIRRTFPQREKIVIPDDEPAETATEETTADLQESTADESSMTIETMEPPAEVDVSPPTEEIPQPSAAEAQPLPNPETDTDEPRRKKRRKRRRRKKSRNKNPEASGDQASPQNSPGSPPNTNSQPGADDDFGNNVF